MSKELEAMFAAARTFEMTQTDLEEQRRSFAYGNASIENEHVTREMIDAAADEIRGKRDGSAR